MNYALANVQPELLQMALAGVTLLGSGLVTSGGLQCVQGWRSRRWRAAAGRVTGIEYRSLARRAGSPLPPWSPLPAKGLTGLEKEQSASLRFLYSYRAAGQDRAGEVLFFGSDELGFRPRERDELLRRFAKGKSVQVFYNPNAPEQAVLIPGRSGGVWTLLIGLVLVAIGVSGLASGWLRLY